MPIISDRPALQQLTREAMLAAPSLSAKQAAEQSLRAFYQLDPSEGIWGGSDAAICMGYTSTSADENVFERIAASLAAEVES